MTYGNKKTDKGPAVCADKDTQRAETCGYHTTVEPWVEGEQLWREMINLIGGEGESVAVFRELILNNCFRKLEVGSGRSWEHLLGSSIAEAEPLPARGRATRSGDIPLVLHVSSARRRWSHPLQPAVR